MNEQKLETEFKEVAASGLVTELIKHLTSANKRLPTFAVPDTIDAVDTLGQIVRTHTNASDETIHAAMNLVSAALVNCLTDIVVTMTESPEAVDEKIETKDS